MSEPDLTAFSRWTEAIEGLDKLPADAARAAAATLERELRANVAAGRAPDGTAWPATAQGTRALTNAGQALAITTAGTRVTATVTGPEALHDQGLARGRVRRQILPRGELPRELASKIHESIGEAFARKMGGAR